MEFNGLEVLKAANGSEAISILKEVDVHLIVSDFRMPKGDGGTILNYINNMEIPKPIFYLFSGDIILNRDLIGLTKYFQKPNEFHGLLSAIKNEHQKYLTRL